MKTKIFLLTISLLFISQVYCQDKFYTKSKKAIQHFKTANYLYSSMNYAGAIVELKYALQIDKNFIEALLLMADSYYQTKQFDESIQSYINVLNINSGYYPSTFYLLANTEFEMGNYSDAKKHYLEFLAFEEDSKRLKNIVNQKVVICDFAIEMIKHPVKFEPVNLGREINSPSNEYSPSLTADEQVIVYTVLVPRSKNETRYMNKMQEDFFISLRKDSSWIPRINLRELNTSGNEGAQTISADGNTMVFTACDREEGFGSCDLYISKRVGAEWTQPLNIGDPVNTSKWESQPAISSDGRTLYFASNQTGGKGNMDIWVTELNDSNLWSEPVNLGDSINTPGNEMSPFIHFDNQTLYFASDNWPGMGGRDLFLSRKDTNGVWHSPVNLGYPINTSAEERNIVMGAKGEMGYCSIERKDGFGGLDIYEFEMDKKIKPEEVNYVKGVVYDNKTKEKLEAKFELIDLETAKVIVQSFSNPGNGEFLVCLPPFRDYALHVTKKGYLFYSENFSLKSLKPLNDPYLLDIPLKQIAISEKAILKNIFFDTDKFNLKPLSQVELNKLTKFLNDNPLTNVEIGGHTDNVASLEHNKKLSFNRAKAVYDYLILNKINPKRLSFKGYDFSQPIATNATEGGRALNRRTEYKIIK